MRVSVVQLAASWRDVEAVTARTAQYRAELAIIGAAENIDFVWYEQNVTAAELATCDGLLMLVLSGGTEQMGLSVMSRWQGPFVMLAHNSDNALPAAMEMLSMAQLAHRVGRIVQANSGWRDDMSYLLRIMRTRHMLGRSIMGAIGARDIEIMSQWALETQVRRSWGTQLVHIPTSELIRGVRSVDSGAAARIADEMRHAACGCIEPDDRAVNGSAKIYLAMRRMVKVHKLDAVTLKCFDLLTPLGNTACYALSRLNDEGVPAACESDIGGCMTMMLMYYLAGQTGFIANPAHIDPESGMVSLAHCMIPTGMCSSHTLRSHYESGLGVGIEGHVDCGPVTVVRIGGPELKHVYVASGKIVEGERAEELCRTQLLVKLDSPDDAAEMLNRPLGNHHIVVPGDHSGEIRDFCEFYLE